MAFNLIAGAWTREALKVPSIDRTGAGGVIGHVNAANYTGSSDTIFEGPPNGWRADRQNPSTTHANIQIQKNGVFNQKSSIGGVLVPLDLAKQIGSVNATGPAGLVAKARFSELTKAIQGGLTRSVGSWRYVTVGQQSYAEYQPYTVTGVFSA